MEEIARPCFEGEDAFGWIGMVERYLSLMRSARMGQNGGVHGGIGTCFGLVPNSKQYWNIL